MHGLTAWTYTCVTRAWNGNQSASGKCSKSSESFEEKLDVLLDLWGGDRQARPSVKRKPEIWWQNPNNIKNTRSPRSRYIQVRERNTFYFREVPLPEPATAESLNEQIIKAFEGQKPVWAYDNAASDHARPWSWNGTRKIYRYLRHWGC